MKLDDARKLVATLNMGDAKTVDEALIWWCAYNTAQGYEWQTTKDVARMLVDGFPPIDIDDAEAMLKSGEDELFETEEEVEANLREFFA